MKHQLTALFLTTGITMISLTTYAQEQQGCFLVNERGQLIDLSAVCEDSQGSVNLSGIYTIPIKRRDAGIPVVDVTFNGEQTFEMLFDTGASGVSINPDMASALNVEIEREAQSETAGGIVDVGLGKVNSIEAGGLKIKDVTVAVNPNSSVSLLGQSFFGDYDVTIKENVIELRRR